jgi:hypothetical protein
MFRFPLIEVMPQLGSVRERFYSFVTVLGTGFRLLGSLVLNAGMTAMRIIVPRSATGIISGRVT